MDHVLRALNKLKSFKVIHKGGSKKFRGLSGLIVLKIMPKPNIIAITTNRENRITAKL